MTGKEYDPFQKDIRKRTRRSIFICPCGTRGFIKGLRKR